MSEPKVVWEIPAELGEGPLWVESENAVYWVDILSKKVHRYGLTDQSKKTWKFDIEVTSLSLSQSGRFVASIRDGFAWINFENTSYEPIELVEKDMLNNRFNDGKVDAQGRYWAGTMDNEQAHQNGKLYRLDPDLSVKIMDDDYIITNGPAFSLDGRTMYHTETKGGIVYAFDVDRNGDISNKRIFTEFDEVNDGLPDGMTVDSEDCIWIAHFGGSRITRYAPSGEILKVVFLPVPNITSCTFAGESLDEMYITTARAGIPDYKRSDYPLAGSLFVYKPGVKGMPTPLFAV